MTTPTSITPVSSTISQTPTPGGICGSEQAPPAVYGHVVVLMEENRTWATVGGTDFGDLPYLNTIASQCTVYTRWSETNKQQSSLTQYIGLTSGIDNPATVDGCVPSPTCHSTDNNIFRQVRAAGGSARTFVEGASSGCSAEGNVERHVPAMYYFAAEDQAQCLSEVRPLDELDVDQLPTFAMIVPDLCNDGHDCDNAVVDDWLSDHLQAILEGASYLAGDTAVFVLYDEDYPVPNLVIAPTAKATKLADPRAGHSAALRTIEELLGLPILPAVADAISLRPSSGL